MFFKTFAKLYLLCSIGVVMFPPWIWAYPKGGWCATVTPIQQSAFIFSSPYPKAIIDSETLTWRLGLLFVVMFLCAGIITEISKTKRAKHFWRKKWSG